MVIMQSHEIGPTELATASTSSTSSTCQFTVDGFTADFQQYLNASAFSLEKWLEQQYEESEKLVARRKLHLQSRKKEIDTTSVQLLELQQRDKEGSKYDTVQQSNIVEEKKDDDDNNILSASSEPSSYEYHLEQLKQIKIHLCSQIEEKKQRIEALELEHSYHSNRASEAQKLKEKVQSLKETTVNDLTKGILNYKYVGLDFEKAEGDRLRMSFTQLDEAFPNQKYSFELGLGDDELWKIENVHPISLPKQIIHRCEQKFNSDDDIAGLIHSMRRAFLNEIESST